MTASEFLALPAAAVASMTPERLAVLRCQFHEEYMIAFGRHFTTSAQRDEISRFADAMTRADLALMAMRTASDKRV